MDNQKISVSLEEVNSPQVDAELHRQEIAGRLAEHQQQIRINFGNSDEMVSCKGSVWRKAMVYMTLFGLLFSILAWGVGECYEVKIAPWRIALNIYSYAADQKMTDEEFLALRDQHPELRDNPYLQDSLLKLSDTERINFFKAEELKVLAYGFAWYISLGILIAVALSIAEPCVSGNVAQAVKCGGLAMILGGIGGFVCALLVDHIYLALGGGQGMTISLQQIFARAVGWGLLGLFVAIAPGICLKSGKKFLLGCTGGFLGGFFGGCLFDPICLIFGSDILARLVNIVGVGVGAAFATVLLENIAKQGWLKVAAGVIAGKQFILYRNPTVIGSSPKCEIYLFKDPQIAPKHAAINNHNGDFVITSIDGAPVYVNDVPERQRRLSSGDRIRIGNTIFIFEAKAIRN